MRRMALAAALAAGCGPVAPERLPRITGAWPTGAGVAPDAVVAGVEFSEAVDPDGVTDGRFFALAREVDARAMVAAAEAPGGIGPQAPVVAGTIALLDSGRRAELRPAAALDAEAAYALVVGSQVRSATGRPVLDPQGRRRPFVSTFRTGELPDRQRPEPRWVRPPHGPLPLNLRAIRLGFGEPVSGALALPGAVGARAWAPAPDQLALDLAADLPPGPLAPSLLGVADAAGNPALPAESLQVQACRDLAPPVIEEGSAALAAGELSIAVQAVADEVALVGLEAAAAPGEPPCGALPAWPATLESWGEAQGCLGYDPCAPRPAACPVAARLEGLCPGRRVVLRLLAEDLAGNRARPGAWRELATAAGVPRPVLAEVLVDAAAPEAGGEYAEVANLGTAEADLAGWTLAKRSATGAWTRCALEPLAGTVPPGGHGLVVGGAYDGRYRLPPGAALYRCGGAALLGGLANDSPPALVLESPGAGAVSALGLAAPLPRCGEHSVERVLPVGPDGPANLACSRASPGTPGACNTVTPPEECPRRPW